MTKDGSTAAPNDEAFETFFKTTLIRHDWKDFAFQCWSAGRASISETDAQDELSLLKEISDDLHIHGHALAAARIDRKINLLSGAVPTKDAAAPNTTDVSGCKHCNGAGHISVVEAPSTTRIGGKVTQHQCFHDGTFAFGIFRITLPT